MIERRRREVLRLAKHWFGTEGDAVHQPYGHRGLTFEVQTPDGEFIVKTCEDPGAFDHSINHVAVLRGLGVKVPARLRHGRWEDFDYLLYPKIPGRDLGHELSGMSPAQMTSLAEEIVAIERKVMSLPVGSGFGWTPMAIAGPFPTWTAVIERDSANAPMEIRRAVDRWRPYFDPVPATCFLDDLTVKNVIVANGEFQGIVDLDEFCYGDPLYWLSLAEVTARLDVGCAADFYGIELRRLWGMTDAESAVCDLYNAIQSWCFLSRGVGEALREWATTRLRRAKVAPRG